MRLRENVGFGCSGARCGVMLQGVLGIDGRCYGFGVILDGEAKGCGDPARGSRYNSAVRYQTTMAPRSVIVVISDDRTVDLIP